MNKLLLILKRNMKEGETHVKRLNSAYAKMKAFMPLSAEKIQKLSEDEIEHVDQYLYRFAKLQDVIGEKIFASLLSFLGEETGKKSFIDIFNRLEQLDIVHNYDKWIKLRLLRNELAHEYEDDPEMNAEKLNSIYNLKNDLEKYFHDIKIYLQRFKEFIN
ncbi:MAG: hypothetical protein R6W90_16795 [Ignavibacteriaceae bacterium]